MESNFSQIHDNQTIDLNPTTNYSGQGAGKGASSMNSLDNNRNAPKLLTLDEPVVMTIKRDLMNVFDKMKNVFTSSESQSHLDSLRTNWDLWGPLIISLAIAFTVTIGSNTDTQQLFTNIFLALWLGPFLISINCQLLGANIMIIQLVSLIIYCSAPIMIFSIVSFVLRLVYKSFVIDLVLGAIAVFLTIRGTKGYFVSLVQQDKKRLMLYPVLLFYIFLATYIAMA